MAGSFPETDNGNDSYGHAQKDTSRISLES